MAPRTRKAAPPPPPPEPTFWQWLRQEMLIAIGVAGSLTVVLIIRRWATELLGAGVLNQDVFAGSPVIAELAARVEGRVRPREEAPHVPTQPGSGARRASGPLRDPTDGGDDDDH